MGFLSFIIITVTIIWGKNKNIIITITISNSNSNSKYNSFISITNCYYVSLARLANAKGESERALDAYESRLRELRISLKQAQGEREKLATDLTLMSKARSAEQDNKMLSMQEENQV